MTLALCVSGSKKISEAIKCDYIPELGVKMSVTGSPLVWWSNEACKLIQIKIPELAQCYAKLLEALNESKILKGKLAEDR